jgi:DNA-binding CsgD family transcriptional regulator
MKVVSLYKGGHSLNALAERFGVSSKTIRNYLIRAGVPRRNRGNWPHPISEAIRERICRMYAKGLSQETIAAKIGYSQSKVSCVLKARGLRTDLDGERNHSWKGGRIVANGYVKVKISTLEPEGQALARAMLPDAAYIPEHRLAMARHLGRPLRKDETVHHIDDRDKQNNALSNLQLRIGQHGKGSVYRCAKCHSIDLEPVPLS